MSSKRKATHIPEIYAACSDVGNVREHNEDSYCAKSPLFVVADGMGGHEAGEVASEIAIKTMLERMPSIVDADSLADAVKLANMEVIRSAQEGIGRPGMGTTLTAALVADDVVTIAQVGDSRAYLMHEGSLQRLTRDHSLVQDLIDQGRINEEDARFHPQRSVITRALGSDPSMQPDIYTLRVEPGDRLLLCSDGLTSMLADRAIESIMLKYADVQRACSELLHAALDAGGLDNVTIIVVDPLASTAGKQTASDKKTAAASTDAAPAAAASKKKPKEQRKGRFAPLIWAILFVLIIAGAGFGFYTYAQNSYYVIEENGSVSVYRGLPGEIAGFSLSWLEEEATDIDVSKLAPTLQARLENGISVDSREDADELLSEYRQTIKSASDVESAQEAASDSTQAATSDTGTASNQESEQ